MNPATNMSKILQRTKLLHKHPKKFKIRQNISSNSLKLTSKPNPPQTNTETSDAYQMWICQQLFVLSHPFLCRL